MGEYEVPPEKLGASHSKNAIRLWLRLLTCTTEIEKLIRNLVSREFATTLPRFDILAALDRHPGGLSMGELSTLLMVSNGNVTAVVNRLVQEGLVTRVASPEDRRIQIVSLTSEGEARFAGMASDHEGWVEDFFAGLTNEEIEHLLTLLNRLRRSVAMRTIARG